MSAVSIAEARNTLTRLIRKAEGGEPVRITRRGEPVAVLVGHRQFKRLSGNRPGFAAAYREFLEAADLSELDLDPDELFEGVRDKSPGRDVSL